MTEGRIQGQVFGEVADDYERVRPGYPAELVDEVVTFAGGPEAGPALEIGAGTGKATVAFARRGYAVTAVEPDPAMAEVLARRTEGLPVTVVASTFEDVAPDGSYALVFSGQAFHWTDPVTRWVRTVAALAPGGALALFWNTDRIADADLHARVDAVQRDLAPAVVRADDPPAGVTLDRHHMPAEFDTRPELVDPTTRVYRWERSLSTSDFLVLLSTISVYRLLDAPVRERLFAGLADEIGDSVTLAEATVLYLAHTRR
jgi:SAM-dependent methyltransferase